MKNEDPLQFVVGAEAVPVPAAYLGNGQDLVRTHHALVRKLAWQVHGRAARSSDFEDLVQVGMMALIEASRTYQDQGHSFATYATIRIRGAMVDHIRRETPIGRAGVTASRRLSAARQRLEQMLHRAPVTSELAAELDMTATDYLAFEQLGSRLPPASLDEESSPAFQLVDEAASTADTDVETAELVTLLTQAVGALNAREQLVLQLFFHEELNLAEIGEVLGVSAARVCQLKGGALKKLHGMMDTVA